MNRILDAYYSLPEIVRKALRDWLVLFLATLGTTGALNGNSPDWRMFVGAVTAAASLALWRVVRSFVENTDPPEPPTSGP
jgi:hypothetical protein